LLYSSVKTITRRSPNRAQQARNLFETLCAKYRGYWNYYGVIGNSASLNRFFYETKRILFRWLNRRSGRGSYTRLIVTGPTLTNDMDLRPILTR
jgi:hypothetical protein